MPISLRRIISLMTLPKMIYLRSKNELFGAEEVDLYNLHIYKNYVILPYIEQATIYDAFLDSRNLVPEKKLLHEQDNFEVAFRIFIDGDKRFVDRNNRYGYMGDGYGYFEIEYLKPIAIEWCNKHRIPYVNDL